MQDFSVVPFPINTPGLYEYYVPLDATFFLTIYDEWGKRKLDLLEESGLKTEVLWTRPHEEKGLSGSDIRKRMRKGEPWEHLVPEATQRLMKEWSIPGRLRSLYDG
jgi:nicotinamide-nucleotide adenylyltransferase